MNVSAHICRVKKSFVMPAKAGIQCCSYDRWMPAFAGMTFFFYPTMVRR